jgi:hypothetical protein
MTVALTHVCDFIVAVCASVVAISGIVSGRLCAAQKEDVRDSEAGLRRCSPSSQSTSTAWEKPLKGHASVDPIVCSSDLSDGGATG